MNQTTQRIDPMTQVLHYELLAAAHSVIAREPNEGYWAAVRVPKRPIGRLSYEEARQISVFAIPLAIVALATVLMGDVGFVLSLPVGWFIGFILDKWLQHAMNKRFRHDSNIDRGRYNATHWLAKQLGMKPEDITLSMLKKMAKDFEVADAKKKAEEAKAAADYKAAIARSVRGGNHNSNRNRFNASNNQQNNHVQSSDTHTYSEPEPAFNVYTEVNPTSGMPMMPGSQLDIAGNAYGTGGPF